jgi:hypothetical protein
VVHELTPGDDHDSSGVIVEALVGVDGARHDTGQRQLATGDGDTRRRDAVGVQGTDQPECKVVPLNSANCTLRCAASIEMKLTW